MAVPAAEQRRVCLRSGNSCAFDGCRRVLSVIEPETGELVVLGEIAHIVAERVDGPRGQNAMSMSERNSYPNLMLLCQEHHQLVDTQPSVYSVERLLAMKDAHEAWVAQRLVVSASDPLVVAPTVVDTVYSTVLPVERMPQHLYSAHTTARGPSDVTPSPASGMVAPFVLHADRLWAFQDLRRVGNPFDDVVSHTTAQTHDTKQMLLDPDNARLLQQLLNRCLNKITGHRGLYLDKQHHRYYFPADEPGATRSVSYIPLNKTSATRKVVWQPVRKSDNTPRKYWLHRAVSLGFCLIDAEAPRWGLSIRPELHVTSDGRADYPSAAIGRRVTRNKARRFNYDLLGEVQFWRDYLSESSPRLRLAFNNQQTLVVSTSLIQAQVTWPGIPSEYAKPYRNVHFLDDLFTWAEATLSRDDDDSDDWDEEADDLDA